MRPISITPAGEQLGPGRCQLPPDRRQLSVGSRPGPALRAGRNRVALGSQNCHGQQSALPSPGRDESSYRLAAILLPDRHDLIHKAVGWSLREAGKRVDRDELRRFLDQFAPVMPRTALRYRSSTSSRQSVSTTLHCHESARRADRSGYERRRVPGDITVERSGAVRKCRCSAANAARMPFLLRVRPGCGMSWGLPKVELDGCLGRAVLEATQAAGIDMQQLSDERHVAGRVAERAPDPYPRRISEQAVDQRSPLKAPLPRHRRGIDAIADRLSVVHEGAGIVLGLVATELTL